MGYNYYGTISNCYSTGSVTATATSNPRSRAFAGGLVGYNYSGIISNCYSTGSVTATASSSSFTGGLIGENYGSGSVVGSFWDINTSGLTDGVGNMDPDPNGVIGKTTAEMKTLSTFTSVGWDFTTPVWKICDGTNYPKLAWQHLPGDFVCPDGVDYYDLAIFTGQWLDDGIVNFLDFAVFANSWHGDMNQLLEFSSHWLQRSAYDR